VLSEGAGLLEHADLNFAERATAFVVGLDQPRELDCSGETGGPAADENDVHRNRFGIGRLGEDQPVERKRRLVPARYDAAGAISH
jgi:hypothetical protein